nr:hypothetical protein CFP56_45437 [Quercus suber]
MALWIMARGTEVVARLPNQISVQSEESSRRNAHNSNSIATDSKRNVKTRSMLEKLCISMTEKSANVIPVKQKLSKRKPGRRNE